MNRIHRSLFLLLFLPLSLLAQPPEYPYTNPDYPFIRYDLNSLKLYGDSSGFDRFYTKLDSLLFYGEGQVNIVHFGGSHIQAGTFPKQVMERFQSFYPGIQGARGFMFPYAAAKTNTPRGYSTIYSGEWQGIRNVDKNRIEALGISGIRISTTDSTASFMLVPKKYDLPEYRTETVRLFCDTGSSFRLVAQDPSAILIQDSAGLLIYEFPDPQDTLAFWVEKIDTFMRPLHFYGLVAMNSDPGVSYHAFGINGATVSSFHGCENLSKQLSFLDADLVILSLGINDAYGRRFSSSRFEDNYDTLIREIRKAAPDAAIILTTNNDSYLYRRYVNRNGPVVRDAMKRIATEQGAGVWDMFTVMGGLSSINLWYAEGLANRDKIHLTRPGYELIGDLLFEAILRSYTDHFPEESNTEDGD